MAAEAKNTYDDDVDDDIYDDSSYVLFKDRKEWEDIQPVEQDDGPYSTVKINYSPKFKDAYDYLRAVIKNGEKSRRVLTLTGHAIIFNAANYTAWQYRRDVLKELSIPHVMRNQTLTPEFEEELTFSKDMIDENNKNYQVWHHRRILVTWAAGYDEDTGKHSLQDQKDCDTILKRELKLTSELLNKDSKNYHAWQHRQWVLKIFNNFANELNYASSLIDIDVRNNSAWNQRFFVVQNISHEDENLISREIQYTIDQIWKAISNESPWSYLRGLLELSQRLAQDSEFLTRCKKLIDADSPSIPLHVFVLEVYDAKIEKGDKNTEMLNHGKQVCDRLASKLDAMRKGYWALRRKVFEVDVS